jgi:SAM-dependent methyltransferase
MFYRFDVDIFGLFRCTVCGLECLDPQPDDEKLRAIYNEDYFLGSGDKITEKLMDNMKKSTALGYIELLSTYVDVENPRLIEVGCGGGDFLIIAKKNGYSVAGVEFSPTAVRDANRKLEENAVIQGELSSLDLTQLGKFDCCVLFDVIEHVRNPLMFLNSVRTLLNDNGVCFIVTPSLNSWSAKVLGRHWMEYKPEHLFYFNEGNIKDLLNNAGLDPINVSPNRKVLNFSYINSHMQKFHVPVFSLVSKLLSIVLPRKLREWNVRIVASGMNVLAKKS